MSRTKIYKLCSKMLILLIVPENGEKADVTAQAGPVPPWRLRGRARPEDASGHPAAFSSGSKFERVLREVSQFGLTLSHEGFLSHS